METDLIFNQQIALKAFAAFSLLLKNETRAIILDYYTKLLTFGAKHNVGIILDSVTWTANVARGKLLGYCLKELCDINKDAIALMCESVKAVAHDRVLLCGDIGPRYDAYNQDFKMSAKAAMDFHAIQISQLAGTELDFITAYTIGYANEAIGIILAAKQAGVPIVVSFTVETNGLLPDGSHLKDVVKIVDAATGSSAAYFMINCAHPKHFEPILNDGEWIKRIGGIVVNASESSHNDLDNALTLDRGDCVSLGKAVKTIVARHPHMKVIGGCCGTDMEHLRHMVS